jgi:hypothetical protein
MQMSDKKANPLENIFDIEPGSTPVFHDIHAVTAAEINERASSLVDPTTGEIVNRKIDPDSDDINKEERIEDLHIDGQLESVHTNAIIAFEKSSRMAEEVDPKFAARNAEVAAQYLTIALNAVNSRVDAKFKRQKVRAAKIAAGAPSTVNNTVIVADRNELLKQIFNTMEKTVDNETS